MKSSRLSIGSSTPFGAEYAWRPNWGSLARSYIRMFGLLDFPSRLRARVVIPDLIALHPKRVLDLGSGTGCYSFYASRKQNTDVSGIEINQRRVSESNRIAEYLERGNVKFLLGDAHECLGNFGSGSFDVALAIEVLQLLPNIRPALGEIYRVLKAGGYLIGHVPVLGHLRPYEVTLFDDQRIQQLLAEANFQTLKIIPTLGGILDKLCWVFSGISRSGFLAGLLFPLMLLVSRAFPVENRDGRYRFFVARKPAEEMSRN